MKSRSKRNKKRPRGGIGFFAGNGECNNDFINAKPLVEVVPLSRALSILSETTARYSDDGGTAKKIRYDTKVKSNDDEDWRKGSVRIVHPYPYTFATFAKARWIGRSVADVYHAEFGE